MYNRSSNTYPRSSGQRTYGSKGADFRWGTFKGNPHLYVKCRNQSEAEEFCRAMHNHGMAWGVGIPYVKKEVVITEAKVFPAYYFGDGTYSAGMGEPWKNNKIYREVKYSFQSGF